MVVFSRMLGGLVCLCIVFFIMSVSAIDYVFPAAAKVIDVTKSPYNADKSGRTDVSAVLSKAANDIIALPSWSPGIMYLPNGTYLVKNTISWKLGALNNYNGPLMLGQSRKGTIVKLAKGTWPLGTELKGVIQTGAGVEQNFSKSIRNLTVLVDSNNAGAIGIVYVSDNTGIMSDVDIISVDGKGAYGIQSAGNWAGSSISGNGPFIIRRTYIKGFQVGFRGCGTQSEMMSQMRLEGQSKTGIQVSCNNLTIDSLWTNDTCPAIEAQAPVLLTHGVLLNGSPRNVAIRNWVLSSFFRDVVTTGYRAVITTAGPVQPPAGMTSFSEFTSVAPVSLFTNQKKSMNLPAKYPPEVAWENDFTKWAFVEDYKTGGRNDAQALQAAIDDPAKTTVCMVGKNRYQLDRAVYVRGNINRIFGTGAEFAAANSNSQLIFDDGSAPIVMIQNVSFPAFSTGITTQVIKKTNRTVVVESMNDGYSLTITGGGETYVTDVCAGIVIDNPQARVYIWQYEGSFLTVKNGMVRAVGNYHEGGGANNITCQGGFTEILGRFEYATICDSKAGKYIVNISGNANVSVAGLVQQSFCNPSSVYGELVSETRGSTTKILYASAGTGIAASPAGANIALFTAYDSAQVKAAIQTGVRDVKPVGAALSDRFSAIKTARGIEVTCGTMQAGPITLLTYDISGRIIDIMKKRSTRSGTFRALIPRSACSGGIVCVELRAQGKSLSRAMVAF